MKTIWSNIKEKLTSLFASFGWAWWVEIVTQNPRCTYYFGPFLSSKEADATKAGYVEDLELEGAQGIVVKIKKNFQQQQQSFPRSLLTPHPSRLTPKYQELL